MNLDYYTALERFIDAMSDVGDVDPEQINRAVSELCDLLRISKIVVAFYDSIKHEAQNKGKSLTLYERGEAADEVYSKRTLTDNMGVAICHIYRAAGDKPWTDDEHKKVERMQKMMAIFISRLRLRNLIATFAYYDDDGYHNLRFFIRYLNRASIDNTLKGKAAIHFNLKHFAAINQQIGRALGSFVMHSYIEQLDSIIGDDGILCRIGGDNFAAMAPVEKLDNVLEHLRGTRVTYDTHSGGKVPVSASVGIFVIPDDFHYTDASDIIDKIMSASQSARNNGKLDVVFFDDIMIANKEKVTKIQQLFPEALDNEEFLVYYQPKVAIGGGSLAGAEALCRWQHNGNIIPPNDFIPVLEQGMDICKLDFYMLDHVCRDIRRWLDEGKNVVRVSVNLSRKHMMDLDLLEHIIDIIDKHNVPHKYLEIELTETTTDVEFRDLKRVVRGLQDEGIYTSVDDFGIGYSSLNLIKEIPWNVLKVDRSFLPVEEDDDTSRRSVMFKYVVAMAQELGLECIAEGVETRAQVNILKENSCDMAQGFYFDRPLPVDEFEKRLNFYKYQSE